jgi:hypothetical protein
VITPLEAGALSLLGVVLGAAIAGRGLGTAHPPLNTVHNTAAPSPASIELNAAALAAIASTGLTAEQFADAVRAYGQHNGVSWRDLTGDTPSTSDPE